MSARRNCGSVKLASHFAGASASLHTEKIPLLPLPAVLAIALRWLACTMYGIPSCRLRLWDPSRRCVSSGSLMQSLGMQPFRSTSRESPARRFEAVEYGPSRTDLALGRVAARGQNMRNMPFYATCFVCCCCGLRFRKQSLAGKTRSKPSFIFIRPMPAAAPLIDHKKRPPQRNAPCGLSSLKSLSGGGPNRRPAPIFGALFKLTSSELREDGPMASP